MLSEYLKQRQARECFGNSKPEEKKKPEPIASKSDKGKATHRDYVKLVKEMMKESNLCELRTPVCTKTATGLHHMKRRGANLMNKKYLKRACDPCNGYLEQFPLFALENELSVSKFSKDE